MFTVSARNRSLARFCPVTAAFLCVFLSIAPVNAQAEKLLVEGDPMLKDWYPPTVVGELKGVEGKVEIEFIVDEKGVVQDPRVKTTSDPRLDSAAVETLKRWTFEPAVDGGKVVPSCLTVPILFSKAKPVARAAPPTLPRALPKTAPKEVRTPDAGYPDSFVLTLLQGRVTCDYTIEPDGRVGEIVITGASSPVFIGSALEAMRKWEFAPATQGHLKLKVQRRAAFDFSSAAFNAATGLQRESLEGFGLARKEGDDAPAWDRAPRVLTAIQPVTPYDLGVAGTEGSATVEFTVSPSGNVTDVVGRSASAPEFGDALAVAARGWRFAAALKNDDRVPAVLTLTWNFPNLQTSETASPLWRQVAAGTPVSAARGLDRPLRPIYREAPSYPVSLLKEKPVGSATIEFVIDEKGTVQLPRVVKATHPQFGFEAVQAISHWHFQPPSRGNELVAVKVAIPFEFAAPKQ